MKLLVTGAWQATPEDLEKLRDLGHEVIWQQQEKEPLVCAYEEVEGAICNGLFLSHPIEKFVNLRYIQLTSAGYDRVPIKYVKTHNIEIHNARGVYSIPMAEHVIAGVLMLYRKMAEFQEFQRQKRWMKLRDLEELYGKNVLILGCGSVGTACAKRFAVMGCHVSGVDVATIADAAFEKVYPLENLDEALPSADIVVATLPLTPETRHLLNDGRLKLLRDNAIVVNISRGAVIDEKALTMELLSRRLRAVLDVFEEEPLDENSPLWQCSNVVLTPHNSFAGEENSRRLAQVIFENLNLK